MILESLKLRFKCSRSDLSAKKLSNPNNGNVLDLKMMF